MSGLKMTSVRINCLWSCCIMGNVGRKREEKGIKHISVSAASIFIFVVTATVEKSQIGEALVEHFISTK